MIGFSTKMSSSESGKKSSAPYVRPGRPRKKRFQGNQRVNKNFEKLDDNPKPSTASKRKLSSDRNKSACENLNIAYEIINFMSVFGVLSEYVRCKVCEGDVEFSTVGHVGLAFQIKLKCHKCEPRYIDSCPKISHHTYDLNTRIAFSMRMLGIGFSELVRFCGLMDLPRFLTRKSYDRIVKSIQQGASAIAQLSMIRAVNKEVELTGDADSIIISGDGSWRKRRFQSLHSIVAVIGNFTGKVLDVNIKSSYCTACKIWERRSGTPEYFEWLEEHEETCASES